MSIHFFAKLPNVILTKISEYEKPSEWAARDATCRIFRERLTKDRVWEKEAQNLKLTVTPENAKEKVLGHYFLPQINEIICEHFLEEDRQNLPPITDPVERNKQILVLLKSGGYLRYMTSELFKDCNKSEKALLAEKAIIFLLRNNIIRFDMLWDTHITIIKDASIYNRVWSEILKIIPQCDQGSVVVRNYLSNAQAADITLANRLIEKFQKILSYRFPSCIGLAYDAFKNDLEKCKELIITLIKKGTRPVEDENFPESIKKFVDAEIEKAEKAKKEG